MKYEKAIRSLPRILMAVAVVSFIREILVFVSFWFGERALDRLDANHVMGQRSTFLLGERLLAIFLGPLNWVVFAAILSVLLSIHDRVANNA